MWGAVAWLLTAALEDLLDHLARVMTTVCTASARTRLAQPLHCFVQLIFLVRTLSVFLSAWRHLTCRCPHTLLTCEKSVLLCSRARQSLSLHEFTLPSSLTLSLSLTLPLSIPTFTTPFSPVLSFPHAYLTPSLKADDWWVCPLVLVSIVAGPTVWVKCHRSIDRFLSFFSSF